MNGVRLFAQRPQTEGRLLPTLKPARKRQSFAAEMPPFAESRAFSHDSFQISGTTRAPVQAKLVVGDVDAPLEREADRVASEVMSGAAGTGNVARPASSANAIQRKCAACEDEENADISMRRKAVDATPVAGVEAPACVQPALQSSARPLDAAAREFMESRFGHGFGDVRIHDDASSPPSPPNWATQAALFASRQ